MQEKEEKVSWHFSHENCEFKMLCFVAFVLSFCNRNGLFLKKSFGFSRRHENKFFHITCTKHKSSIFGQLPLLSSQTKDIVCTEDDIFICSPNTHRLTKRDRDSETNSSFPFAHLLGSLSLDIIDWLRITWSDEVTVTSNFFVYSARICIIVYILCLPHRFIRHSSSVLWHLFVGKRTEIHKTKVQNCNSQD